MSLSDTLRRVAVSLLSRRRRSRLASSQPAAVAPYVGGDEIHDILREAEGGRTDRLFALYRDIFSGDSHIQAQFNTRKLAVLGDPCRIVADSKAPGAADIAAACQSAWADLPGKRQALTHLLESSMYPLAVLIVRYAPSKVPGRRFDIAALDPVEPDFLDLRESQPRIYDSGPDGRPLSTSHPVTPGRHIIHRGHLLTSPDCWGGPARAALFWWLFKTQGRDWWARFMERFGSPFLTGYYDSADDRGRAELAQAFSAAQRLFGIVATRETKVDVHSVNTASHGDAFAAFHDTANKELSKLILGQTMTADAQGGGIGGSQAEIQDRVRGDIRAFDASALGETLRDQLWIPFCRYNGWPDSLAPVQTWGLEDSPPEITGELLVNLANAGLEPTDAGVDAISARLGIPLQRSGAAPGSTRGASLPEQAAANAEQVADTALNGAQTQSLVQVVQAVAAHSLPPGAAMEILRNSFPHINLQKMLAEAVQTPSQLAADVTATDPLDAIARAGAAPLARAWRDQFAPLSEAVDASTSPADLHERLAGLMADLDPYTAAAILDQAMTSGAFNGAVSQTRRS